MVRHLLNRFLPLPVVVALLVVAGCGGRSVDLPKALQLTDVITGWFDAGIVERNKNKLVPSISVRVRNADVESISSVQLLARFSRVGETTEWGSAAYVRAVGVDGLGAGQSTGAVVIRCDRGYASEQPRAQMLENSMFVDARVEVFAKHQADKWVKMGEYRIARQLLVH